MPVDTPVTPGGGDQGRAQRRACPPVGGRGDGGLDWTTEEGVPVSRSTQEGGNEGHVEHASKGLQDRPAPVVLKHKGTQWSPICRTEPARPLTSVRVGGPVGNWGVYRALSPPRVQSPLMREVAVPGSRSGSILQASCLRTHLTGSACFSRGYPGLIRAAGPLQHPAPSLGPALAPLASSCSPGCFLSG